MEFGDVESAEGLELSLPPDDPITARALKHPGPPARVRVGLPIWNKREWIGEIYPRGTDPHELLQAYGARYDTVEVNSTFYAPPSPEVTAGWARAVPSDFRFLPKVWKALSHVTAPRREDADRWLDSVQAFGDRLGPSFLQLPPHADLAWRRPLWRLIEMLAPHVRLTLELRHPAWLGASETHERLFAYLAEHRIGLVICDTVGRRDLLHMGVTCELTLVRWKGHGLGPRDGARMDDWAARLAAWSALGLGEAYFIGHERTDHEREAAPHLRHLADELRARGLVVGRSLEPPPPDPQLGLL